MQDIILDIGYYEVPNIYLKGNVIGIDIQKGIKPKNYNKIIQCDITEGIKIKDNYADIIILSYILEHIEKHLFVLKECYRILKPKGKIIIVTPNPLYYWNIIHNIIGIIDDKDKNEHIHSFTKRDMTRILKMIGFKDIKYYGTNIMIPKTKINIQCINYPLIGYGTIYKAIK